MTNENQLKIVIAKTRRNMTLELPGEAILGVFAERRYQAAAVAGAGGEHDVARLEIVARNSAGSSRTAPAGAAPRPPTATARPLPGAPAHRIGSGRTPFPPP